MKELGYDENDAPAILLKSASGEAHAKISAAQRIRRAMDGGWDTSLIEEFNIGYKELIDAGVSKKDAQRAMKKAYRYFHDTLKIKINN